MQRGGPCRSVRHPVAGIAMTVRRILADGLELLQVRLQLFSLEAQEDLQQLLSLFLRGVLALALLCLGLALLVATASVLLWERFGVWALLASALLLLLVGGLLLLWTRHGLRKDLRYFRSSLQELADDRTALMRHD